MFCLRVPFVGLKGDRNESHFGGPPIFGVVLKGHQKEFHPGGLPFFAPRGSAASEPMRHGIPDDRPLEDGDILNVDVTARFFFAPGQGQGGLLRVWVCVLWFVCFVSLCCSSLRSFICFLSSVISFVSFHILLHFSFFISFFSI